MPRPAPPADLIREALAGTKPAARRPPLRALAGAAGDDPGRVAAFAAALLDGGARGKRAFLEWLPLVRGPLPAGVRRHARSLLADRRFTPSARVNAAAALLRSLPDDPAHVRPVTRALTAGAPGLRALDRLRQLQNRLERSAALDALIDQKERRVKLDCPRCGVRHPRPDMVRHLWADHQLLLVRGKVRSLGRLGKELRDGPVALRDPDRIDRAAALGGTVSAEEGEAVLRKWLAATGPKPAALAPLLEDAAGRGAGLCPSCLADLPAPFAPLPPPLESAPGRLAGDGYVSAVTGEGVFRSVAAFTPAGRVENAGPGPSLPTRAAATLFVAPFVLAALLLALALPARKVPPLRVTGGLLGVAAAGYVLIRVVRRPGPGPDETAARTAWNPLARVALDRDDGTARRFLTRLCRSSLGRGDPGERATVLNAIAERAEETGDWPLAAAGRVLRVDDGGRYGRDRVAGIADLVADALRGRRPLPFAEFVLDAFLNRPAPPTSGEVARLRALVLAAAFGAGLRPRTLLDLGPVLPNLRRATLVEPAHRLGLLHGVATLVDRPWEAVAPADTVFELARTAPNLSGRLLTAHPDLLLAQKPEAAGDDLFPILVCCRGVVVAGQMVADPAAEVDVRRAGAGYELVLGPYRVAVRRRPSERYLETVRGWLRFRAEVLLRFLDGYREKTSGELARLAAPVCVTCPRCETRAAVAAGRVGVEVRG